MAKEEVVWFWGYGGLFVFKWTAFTEYLQLHILLWLQEQVRAVHCATIKYKYSI